MTGPWDFDQARDAARKASAAQKATEDLIRVAYREHAQREEAYRVALAQRVTELHAEGIAWSATHDLARGDKRVARLKTEALIAEGVREAAKQAGWKASKDREDVQCLIDWSKRREFAEAGVGG